jgi:hypothetical protein
MYGRKPEVSKKVGRYRMRYLGDAENDLKQINLNKWRKMANNREDHGLVMTEAKILRGSISQGGSSVKKHSGTSTPLVARAYHYCTYKNSC